MATKKFIEEDDPVAEDGEVQSCDSLDEEDSEEEIDEQDGEVEQEQEETSDPPASLTAVEIPTNNDALLLVDAQKDFYAGGAVAVPGAHAKYLRTWIDQMQPSLILASTINHSAKNMQHRRFWIDDRGRHPAHGSFLPSEEILAGRWEPCNAKHRAYIQKYTNQVAGVTVWDDFCVTGTSGHNLMFPDLEVEPVPKAHTDFAETFSMFRAEVPIRKDDTTHLQTDLLKRLRGFDRVFVAGPAMSHGVAATLTDLMANWPRRRMKDIVLVSKSGGALPGFKARAKEMIDAAKKSGITVL